MGSLPCELAAALAPPGVVQVASAVTLKGALRSHTADEGAGGGRSGHRGAAEVRARR